MSNKKKSGKSKSKHAKLPHADILRLRMLRCHKHADCTCAEDERDRATYIAVRAELAGELAAMVNGGGFGTAEILEHDAMPHLIHCGVPAALARAPKRTVLSIGVGTDAGEWLSWDPRCDREPVPHSPAWHALRDQWGRRWGELPARAQGAHLATVTLMPGGRLTVWHEHRRLESQDQASSRLAAPQ